MDLFARVEEHRERARIDRSELIRRAGLTRPVYYRIKDGSNVSVDTVCRIAHVLGVDPGDLLRDGPTAASPEAARLARRRELLRPDGTAHPDRFGRAVDLAWNARFNRPTETT